MRLHELPLHVVDTAVAVVGDGVEEVLREIEVGLSAAWAAVDDLALELRAIRTGDADVLATKWVVVGVAVVVRVKDGLRDSYNRIAGDAVLAASTKADLVPGQVTAVGSASLGQAGADARSTARGRSRVGRCSWCRVGCGRGSGWCNVGRCWWWDISGSWRSRDWCNVDGGAAWGRRNVDRGAGWCFVDRGRAGAALCWAAWWSVGWRRCDSRGSWLNVRGRWRTVSMRLLSRRSLAWLNPDSLGDWDRNNLLFGVGNPDVVTSVVVVMLLGHWHGSDDREERAGHGKNTVGEHG